MRVIPLHIAAILWCALALPSLATAQELHSDLQAVWKARVVATESMDARLIPGTQAPTAVQILVAEILEGPRIGDRVSFENDYIQLEPGERFYLNYLKDIEGHEFFSVREPDRSRMLILIGLLFAVAVALFGGVSGVRSLAALSLSLGLIIFALLPLLLAGWPPLPTSLLFAMGILALAMGLTHGISRPSVAALLGALSSVLLAGVTGSIAVSLVRLSGFASDEAVFLNIGTSGTLDMQGLLLAAIIIGVLGVLDDITITQASAVEEIYASRGGEISGEEMYRRASRIGRAHIGAVVNTLALAYVGASLPLLLLFSFSDFSPTQLLNQEIIATEIVRTAVGSIALAVAVPITTLIAVYLVRRWPQWKPKHHQH